MAAENRGPELLYVCAVMVSLAFVSTSLRIYVRLGLVKAFGIDDWFMVAATLTHIMFATCAIGGIHYGTGQHMANLSHENAMKAMRYWWLCYVAYCLTMISAKISIGYFLLRLTVHRIHVWIIWTVMSLTVLTGAVFFFVTLFQCDPIEFFWTQNLGAKGSCINVEIIIALTYLYGSISAICDFTFGILPIFLIWNLNMRKSLKIALVPILSMACIASSAVLVRMAYVKDFRNPDFLYATVDIAIWSDTEQGLAITAGSLATLRPLFRMLTSKLGSYGGTGGRATPNPSQQLTPGGIHKQNTVWPSEQSRGRSGSRGGPWSLLRTETDGDFEMVTKVTKISGGDSPPPPTDGRGITKGTEVQVFEERIQRGSDEQAAGREKRKSWWQVMARETSRESSDKEDSESQRKLNAHGAAGTGPKRDPGDFV